MSQTIPSGPYFGFTKTELQTELERYKSAVKQSGSSLIGASQSGQSYQWGPRGDWNLAEWQDNLQAALAFFGLADCPPGSNEVVRYGNYTY